MMDVNDFLEDAKDWFRKLFEKESPASPSPVSGESNEKAKSKKLSLGNELASQGLLTGEGVSSQLAEQFGMPVYNDISMMRLSKDYYEKVPYSFVKRHRLLPISEEHGKIIVAVSDPLDLDPLEELRILLGKDVVAVYTPREIILTSINECYDTESGAASQLIADLTADKSRRDDDIEVYDLLEETPGQSPIIKLLNLIITEAIQQGASDIHFEPFENSMRVRYRIDGVLQTRHNPAQQYQSQLMTRVKVMAKLDIAERRLPQDGRIKLKMGRREIDFRVSTIPVSGGERIVLRILDKGSVMLGLPSVGMLPDVLKRFKEMIHTPEGIVLVTGPTGSGKTTTLYSAVNELYNEETNIMTIEDPIEYNLQGIAQIGVKPEIGLTFASGLRTILRQDPDIVMVGEIRDVETAVIAIQASLTGHLVLSTLHTNDAPSAITRLVDMGIEPYLISSSVIGVLAQRLVRKICPNCKTAYKPGPEDLKNLGLKEEDLKHGELFKGKGCELCFGSGYKGRHGVFELMAVGNEIKKQIVKSPDAVEMRRIAIEEGMIPLRQNAAEVVRRGETTISEALRVVKGVEE